MVMLGVAFRRNPPTDFHQERFQVAIIRGSQGSVRGTVVAIWADVLSEYNNPGERELLWPLNEKRADACYTGRETRLCFQERRWC